MTNRLRRIVGVAAARSSSGWRPARAAAARVTAPWRSCLKTPRDWICSLTTRRSRWSSPKSA